MIQADETVTVTRFALDYTGPTLIVEYSTSADKTFLRRIRFKRYPSDADPERVTKRLMKQFNDILGPQRVSKDQVMELVSILLSATPMGVDAHRTFFDEPAGSTGNVHPPPDNAEDEFGDLNRVSEEDNKRAKDTMNIIFAANSILPDDSSYVYNKVVEFGPPEENNEWDDED
jgi:hypothetical protein